MLDTNQLNSEIVEKIQNEIKEATEQLKSKTETPVSKLETDDSENNETQESENLETLADEVQEKIQEVTDSYEDEARSMGWNPDHTGPNKKSAEQFVKDGSFFKKIDNLKKDQAEMKALIKQLADHNARLDAAKTKNELAQIAHLKLEAVKNADLEQFNKVEKAEELIKEAAKLNTPSQTIASPAPVYSKEVDDFKAKHSSWLASDSSDPTEIAMRALVQSKAAYYMKNVPQSDAIALKDIEDTLKAAFPHKFENQEKKKPAMVGMSSHSNTKDSELVGRLSKTQKDILRQAQKYGSKLTAEKYANQLLQTGELRDE